MEKYLISEQKLVDIADAIREKTETSEPIVVSQMDEAIRAIQVGVDTSDATAEASDIMVGKTAYVKEEKITGTFSLDSEISAQDDLITQITTALDGKAAVSLPTLSNPATADIIPSGYETIDGDGNVITGTGSNLGDATAQDVINGKIFTSSNGLRIVGNMVAGLNIITDNVSFDSSNKSITIKGITEIPEKYLIIINMTSGQIYTSTNDFSAAGHGYSTMELLKQNGTIVLRYFSQYTEYNHETNYSEAISDGNLVLTRASGTPYTFATLVINSSFTCY